MKKFLQRISKNWATKLAALVVAILIWFLIRQQLDYSSYKLREPVPNAQWTD